ncbi:MAG: hypothetical protein LAO19_21450 [Acidobacteriia bacterium]|nr:hypothetical protein [Terriglobia bacterium]
MYKIAGNRNLKLEDLTNAVKDHTPEEREEFLRQLREEQQERIAREQVLKDFLNRNTKQYTSEELVRQIDEEEGERKERSARLAALFANEADREQLILDLYDQITNLDRISFAKGVLGGNALAEGFAKLEKGKRPNKAIKKIMWILLNNPKATTREVFLALDDAGTELYRSKTVPKHVRLWSDVVNEPYYKNLVSRLRKKAARATRLRQSQTFLDSIDTFQGIKRKDFVW